MEINQKNILAVLAELSMPGNHKKEIISMPKRPREKATKVLESDEVLHLARHLIKITLWPDTSYAKGWSTEIKTSLDNLAFGLCKFCKRKGKDKFIAKLWYGANDLMRRLDSELGDVYWDVIDDMADLVDKIKKDPFDENDGQDFTDIGYEIKEEYDDDKGIYFALYYKGKRFI